MSEASFNEVRQRASERASERQSREARSNGEKIFKGLLESLLDLLKSIVFSYFRRKLLNDNNRFNFLFSTAMGLVDCKQSVFLRSQVRANSQTKGRRHTNESKSLTARICTGAVQV